MSHGPTPGADGLRRYGRHQIETSLRDVETRGLTPTGRQSLRTAIEATKSLMGIA